MIIIRDRGSSMKISTSVVVVVVYVEINFSQLRSSILAIIPSVFNRDDLNLVDFDVISNSEIELINVYKKKKKKCVQIVF